jgi:dihydrolipoamide dehydrogenase
LGISVSGIEVDLMSILRRVNSAIKAYRNKLDRGLGRLQGLDLYHAQGFFVDDHTVSAGGEILSSPSIFIAAGARPILPENMPDETSILTNENILDLDRLPEKVIIIGGGYIACEYAHFLLSMGSQVTIVEMAEHLLNNEDLEISALVEKTLAKKATILTNSTVNSPHYNGNEWQVNIHNSAKGTQDKLSGSHILYATGRKPNTDRLGLENTRIKTNEKGYIRVDEYLQTSAEGVFAIGDINGHYMFRHAANYQAEIAWHNATHAGHSPAERLPVEYSAMPRAVFTRPQVAAVGLTEAKAAKSYTIAVGKTSYFDTAMGEAMQQKEGFAKLILDRDTGRILGFHIAGPHASILIQEVVNAMSADGTVSAINSAVHIHPALTELIPYTLSSTVED